MDKPQPGNVQPDSRAGSRLGPYALTRLLGRGGLGEVYAAEDTRDDRQVAVKLIDEQFSRNAEFRARVKKETDAAGRLTDPHVVAVDEHGEIDDAVFLEMRLIDGTDLAALLRRSGPLSPPRAVAIVTQIAAALDAAHAAGVLHGDVKPENILVTAEDFAYLVDFGIACAADDADRTAADDVYALAWVLTACVTGSSADQAPLPPPSKLRPGRVPAALDKVVARSLANKPEDRYHSAGELAAAARAALTQPEQNQVARILRRGEGPSGPTGPVGLAGAVVRPVRTGRATLPSQFTRPRWHTPVTHWLRKRRKPVLVVAAAVAGVVVVGVAGQLLSRPAQGSSAAAPRQVVLPFPDLDYRLAPSGVALDTSGDVYVTSRGVSGRMVKLPVGSTTAVALPFGDLYQPQGVAVDAHNNVYFSDLNDRVVKVDAGSDVQSALPFAGLDNPGGIAVDSTGNVYVADRSNNQVVKLEAGSNLQTVLPFSGLRNPGGVAVDNSGSVYVTDTDNNRVLKLAGGWGNQPAGGGVNQIPLPFTGIVTPWGIAVADDGSVYVTEYRGNKVAKLAAGAAIPTVLPFTGLNSPSDVAVDKSGNVYVADRGNDRVLKLPA